MKVGIAGCGFMGEVHATNYKKLGLEIYAIAEKNKSRSDRFAQKFSPVKRYSDIAGMISDKEVEIIDICLPTPFHGAATTEALKQNKHVLLEKPVTLSLEEAEAIKKVKALSTGKFMVAHVLRFWPQYTIIRKLFEQKKLENVKEVYASRINELPLWSEDTWIMNEEKSGGIIIDLMIHDIDFLLWNLGKVKRVWSKGIPNNRGFHIQVLAILEFENGTVAYIEGSYLNPFGAGLDSQMRIYGEKAKAEMYSNENKIKYVKDGGIEKKLEAPKIDGYFKEISYFVDCIKNDREPYIITLEDAIESLKVCLGLYNSLKSGKWINI